MGRDNVMCPFTQERIAEEGAFGLVGDDLPFPCAPMI